jgi:hypothetical protein
VGLRPRAGQNEEAKNAQPFEQELEVVMGGGQDRLGQHRSGKPAKWFAGTLMDSYLYNVDCRQSTDMLVEGNAFRIAQANPKTKR